MLKRLIYFLKKIVYLLLRFIKSFSSVFTKQDEKKEKTFQDTERKRKKEIVIFEEDSTGREKDRIKLIIKEIENYIKNNYVNSKDLGEIRSLINYAKEIIKTDNSYKISKVKNSLEEKFWLIKKEKKKDINKNEKDFSSDIPKEKETSKEKPIILIEKEKEENKNQKEKEENQKEEDTPKPTELKSSDNKNDTIIDTNIYNKKEGKINKTTNEKEKEKREKAPIVNSKITESKEKKVKSISLGNKEKILTNFEDKKLKLNKEKSHKFILTTSLITVVNYVKRQEKVKKIDTITKDKNNRKKRKIITTKEASSINKKKDYPLKKISKKIVKIEYLKRELGRIYSIALLRINNIERTIAISFKILLLKNRIFFINSKRNNLKLKYNNVKENKLQYKALVNEALSSLDDIKLYVENNYNEKFKNSEQYLQIVSYINKLKNSLTNSLESIKEEDNVKTLKKVES